MSEEENRERLYQESNEKAHKELLERLARKNSLDVHNVPEPFSFLDYMREHPELHPDDAVDEFVKYVRRTQKP